MRPGSWGGTQGPSRRPSQHSLPLQLPVMAESQLKSREASGQLADSSQPGGLSGLLGGSSSARSHYTRGLGSPEMGSDAASGQENQAHLTPPPVLFTPGLTRPGGKQVAHSVGQGREHPWSASR